MNDRFQIKEMLEQAQPKRLSESEKASLWNSISYTIQKAPRVQKESHFLSIIKITRMRYAIIPAMMIVFLLFGSVGTAVYADSSRPGDTLFPVKLASENARIFFAFGQKKNELRLKFAQERVDEVKEVIGFRLARFEDFVDNENENENTQATSTVNTSATSTESAFQTATSSNSNSQNNNKEDDDNDEDVSEESINKTNTALTVAIDYLTKTKEKMLADGNNEAVMAIDAMISELTAIADQHITKVETKIVVKDEKTKVNIEAKTNDLKVKFNLKDNGDNDLKVEFEKNTKNNNKKDDDDDDDDKDGKKDKDDDDRDDDKKDKDHKIVICHKGETIEIAESAYWAHKFHGDSKGECDGDDDDDDNKDTTAPLIKDIKIFTTTQVAEIEWRTNERTNGYVLYATTSPVTLLNSKKKISDDERDDRHDVRISALPDNTKFYFVIVAKDLAGNTATSSEKTFTTKEEEDNTDPEISNISLAKSTSTVSVVWDTNENTTGKVYIATTSPASSENDITSKTTANGTSHQALFSGLSPDTTYYLTIVAKDASGNEDTEHRSITTDEVVIPDTTAPVISSISVSGTTVSWVTNEAATSRVWYASTTPVQINTAQVKSNNSLVVNHSLALDGTVASTTYYYVISSTDSSGNTATSSEHSFVTP